MLQLIQPEYIYRLIQVIHKYWKLIDSRHPLCKTGFRLSYTTSIRRKTQWQFLVSHAHRVIGCKLLSLIHCLEEIPLKYRQRRKAGELPPIHFSYLPVQIPCFCPSIILTLFSTTIT